MSKNKKVSTFIKLIIIIVEMGKKQKQDKRHTVNPQHFEVFVSGLPYEATEEDVKNFFDFAASPTVKLPKYQDTGRCLGYGHV